MKRLVILSLLMFLLSLTLVRADVKTDKAVYKPGETVSIVLDYTNPLTNVQVDIINPNGNKEVSNIPMASIDSNQWFYNYTLNTRALSGTYTMVINALQGGEVVNASMPAIMFAGFFDVLAWNANAYLNKENFTFGDSVNLTMIVTDKYSDKLTFQVFYSINDSEDYQVENKSLTLTEVNNGFTDLYEIPPDYNVGVSKINIKLIDSDGRTLNKILSFSVSKPLSIIPDAINETVTNTVEKTFQIYNIIGSDANVKSIEVSDNLKNYILVTQRPYTISSNGNNILKISIVAANMTEGSYSGTINISTDKGDIPIFVNLKVIPSGNGGIISLKIDYSYIIWYFAAGVVSVIVVLTVLRYRKIMKKKKEEKRKREESKKKVENYYKSQEEYRTEYY